MNARKGQALGALLFLTWAAPSFALDIHVDAAVGSDANDGLTWASAKATVGAGLALAVTLPGPDAVRVAEARYVGQVVMPPETSLIGGYASGGLVRDVLRRPTILDGAGVGPVVSFGPGTDASMLDGFVVTGGRTNDVSEGGGITMVQSAGTVSRCILERNEACRGAGMQLRDPKALLLAEVIIRENLSRCSATVAQAGGLYVEGWIDNPTLRDVAIIGNVAMDQNDGDASVRRPGGVQFRRTAQVLAYGLLIVGNGGTGHVGAGLLMCDNCAIADNSGWAMLRACEGDYLQVGFTSATLHGSARGAFDDSPPFAQGFGGCTILLDQSVVGAGQTFPTQVQLNDACFGFGEYVCAPRTTLFASSSPGLCQPASQPQDPLFVSGPGGTFYLSHGATGQPADSPAVDADVQPASDFGLEARTTRTDHVPDSGALDWGYHFEVSPTLWTVTDFRVLRGSDPRALPVHLTGIASLPWTDAPGVLSDPALPLLFYSVEWPLNRILVTKDAATNSVRLAF